MLPGASGCYTAPRAFHLAPAGEDTQVSAPFSNRSYTMQE